MTRVRVIVAISALVLPLAAMAACDDEGSGSLPAGDDAPQATQAPPPAATPCMNRDPCEPPHEETNLTEDEIELAISAAKNDAILSELLGDAAYEVGVGSQAWEFRDDVTFVTVNFSLAEPLPIDADLPRLDTGSRGGESDPTTIELPPPGYVVETEHHELDAHKISALVYLETGEVMEIFPLPFPLDGLDTGAP